MAMPGKPRPVRLFESSIPSGNAYKVQLAASMLGLSLPSIELDILAQPSQTRTPEFLAKNPNGRIPVVELDDGTFLAESGAILFYLAEETPMWPDDPLARASTLQWMFFEQYSHEPYVAVLKFWTYWGGLANRRPDEIALWRTRGQAALDVMNSHLQGASFFSWPRFGIADVALFAYTQGADDVGFSLAPAVRGWLERVREQPGYVPMKPDPLGKKPTLP
jgi:glutathione S-transferase